MKVWLVWWGEVLAQICDSREATVRWIEELTATEESWNDASPDDFTVYDIDVWSGAP